MSALPAATEGGTLDAPGRRLPGVWNRVVRPEPEAERAFVQLVEATRRLQDLVAGARPDAETAQAAVAALASAEQALARCQVAERDQLAGRLQHLPGRAQTLVPPLRYESEEDDHVHGLVRFSRLYLGGNGAAHGGVLPLVFDEVLGRLAGAGGRQMSRTAYLHVNYRKITPLDRDLQFRGDIDRLEGRKTWVTGSLHDGEHLLADAEGLFVALKPGQP